MKRHELQPGRVGERGFSLLELLIVIVIIGIVAGLAFNSRLVRPDAAFGGPRAVGEVTKRLLERQTAAVRLNPKRGDNTLDGFTMPPVEIDFAAPATTRALVTDGVDEDGDGRDDNSGEALTKAVAPANAGTPGAVGTWSYAYAGKDLSLPTGWRIATSAADLGSIQLIASGQAGRGVLATRFGFDERGRALASSTPAGTLSATPPGSPTGAAALAAGPAAAPFWALYLVGPGGNSAAAVVVHPTGALESWRWNGTTWEGFGHRTP
jgi:prepilin-type N-terminal cleavage/methylation domain-containing protein